MKKPRKRHLPPPRNAGYRCEVIEVSAADDLINAGKPLPPTVELTPAGPPLLVVELRAEDDLAAPRSGAPATPEPQTRGTSAAELGSGLAALLAASENPQQVLLGVLRSVSNQLEAGHNAARATIEQALRAVESSGPLKE